MHMSLNEPFKPEEVEQQLAQLSRSLQESQEPLKANQRLIADMESLYLTSKPDLDYIDRVWIRLEQRMKDAETTGTGNLSLLDSMPHPGDRISPIRRRSKWLRYFNTVAAIIILGVMLTGAFLVYNRTNSSSGGISNGLNVVISPPPIFYNSMVYVNLGDHLQAFQSTNGTLVRTYPLQGLIGSPTIVNGVIYISANNTLYALRVSDGKLLWHSPKERVDVTPPLVVNGVLYGWTLDKKFYALRADDGKLLWEHQMGNPDEFFGLPVVLHGVVYFTSYIPSGKAIDARLYALSANNGMLLWYRSIAKQSIYSLKTDGKSLYTIVDGFAEALKPDDGSLLWRYKVDPSSTLLSDAAQIAAIVDGTVYVTVENGFVYALQVANGMPLWCFTIGSGASFGSLDAADGIVYFGVLLAPSKDGYSYGHIFSLRANDGHLLWQDQIGMQEILNPTEAQETIYLISMEQGQGNLYALQASNGSVLWHHIVSAK